MIVKARRRDVYPEKGLRYRIGADGFKAREIPWAVVKPVNWQSLQRFHRRRANHTPVLCKYAEIPSSPADSRSGGALPAWELLESRHLCTFIDSCGPPSLKTDDEQQQYAPRLMADRGR